VKVFGIKRSRLRKKVLEFRKPIQDGRGRHDNRPTRTAAGVQDTVRQFISALPARESHYSLSCNVYRKYLDSSLSVRKLHRLYLAEHPEQSVSYVKFYRMFTEEFNVVFGRPRSDTCETCERMQATLRCAMSAGDDRRSQELQEAHQNHLREAQVFFDLLRDAKTAADESALVLCMDYEKNLPLPLTNVGPEYYKRQLWVHIFGIHDVTTGQGDMFMYSEQYASKGPNEVISCLQYYLTKFRKESHTRLVIFADNCYAQNKNRYLMGYLDALCARRIFEQVTVHYPVPGHSMMPVDRDFAKIEKARRRMEKCEIPDQWVDLVKNAQPSKPFRVHFVEKPLRADMSVHEDDDIVDVMNYKAVFASSCADRSCTISVVYYGVLSSNERDCEW
jgi:hypothetical protein